METNAASVVLKETAITYLKKNLILKTLFKYLSNLNVHVGHQPGSECAFLRNKSQGLNNIWQRY